MRKRNTRRPKVCNSLLHIDTQSYGDQKLELHKANESLDKGGNTSGRRRQTIPTATPRRKKKPEVTGKASDRHRTCKDVSWGIAKLAINHSGSKACVASLH